MKYHTHTLVMLGIGVWASCHSRARVLCFDEAHGHVCKGSLHRQSVWLPCPFDLLFGASCRCSPVAPAYLLLLPLCMSALCRLLASVSNSPALAFPTCLKIRHVASLRTQHAEKTNCSQTTIPLLPGPVATNDHHQQVPVDCVRANDTTNAACSSGWVGGPTISEKKNTGNQD